MVNKKNIKYNIAIVILILHTIYQLTDLVPHIIQLILAMNQHVFWEIVLLLAYILILIGLIIKKPQLSAAGAFFQILYSIPLIKVVYELIGYNSSFLYDLFLQCFITAIWILMFIILAFKKTQKKLLITVVILLLILHISVLIINLYEYNYIDLFSWLLETILDFAYFGSIGILTLEIDKLKVNEPIASNQKEMVSKVNDDQINRLLKLKDLLDNNIITQEEFDAKKRDILGG